jgi:predicted patatin/cPLA2 family phospholipase
MPALYDALLKRTDSYNASLDFIDNPPADCRLTVVAPDPDFPVNRLTTNPQKLDMGYQQGHRAGLQSLGVEMKQASSG